MLINAFLEGINLQDLGGHFTGLTTHGVNGFELLRQLTLEYSLRTRSEALSLRTALAGRSFEPSRSGASVCTASCIGRVVSQVWRFDVVVAGQWGYKATSHIIRSVSNVRVDILCFSIDDGGAGNLTGRPQWPWSCRDFGSRNEWSGAHGKHLESSISGGTVLDYNRGASALGLWSTESRVRSCHLKREAAQQLKGITGGGHDTLRSGCYGTGWCAGQAWKVDTRARIHTVQDRPDVVVHECGMSFTFEV
ncbi:unnamed protein product [Durusdinium trenchii]|uniref:Subtilisin n=1 Tax=Durusdinium trenchii TaxID=1381693 RepID=A0ABP0RZ05_9DINO